MSNLNDARVARQTHREINKEKESRTEREEYPSHEYEFRRFLYYARYLADFAVFFGLCLFTMLLTLFESFPAAIQRELIPIMSIQPPQPEDTATGNLCRPNENFKKVHI